jgi:hypothetical protein
MNHLDGFRANKLDCVFADYNPNTEETDEAIAAHQESATQSLKHKR